jgi:hypothetical protein
VDAAVVEALERGSVVSVKILDVIVVDYVRGDGGVVLVTHIVVSWDEVAGAS